MPMMITTTMVPWSISFSFWLLFLLGQWLDGEPESVNSGHAHARSGGQGRRADGVPILAANEHHTIRREFARGYPGFADHAVCAGGHFVGACPHHERHEQNRDGRKRHCQCDG